jgi:hypothetical protein
MFAPNCSQSDNEAPTPIFPSPPRGIHYERLHCASASSCEIRGLHKGRYATAIGNSHEVSWESKSAYR